MFEQAFKNIDDVLWKEAGCTTELDYTEQTSWLLFLKYLDGLEEDRAAEAALAGRKYTYLLSAPFRWETWAAPKKADGTLDDNKALTGPDLVEFVNTKLFPHLHGFKTKAASPQTLEYKIGEIFGELKNKITSGYNLREIIDHIDELRFRSQVEKHELSALYEEKIKRMGNAGRNGGEYYTPRPLIRAIIRVTAPKIGERIYDGACGSAGFLCEAHDYLKTSRKLTTKDLETLQARTFYGKEKKSLAYVIGIMNMILHGIEAPNIIHTNTLAENVNDLQEKDRYDIILANPPFGGKERPEVQQNFTIRTGETAFLFLQHFLKSLRAGGRAAIVIKNTFLSNTDNASVALRKLLVETCNLHTVLDCPQGTFQGAGVKTVVLFFEKGLKFDSPTTQRFVELYLESIPLNQYITGAAQPKLNQKALNSIPIPVPPLMEQKGIVGVLDKAFAGLATADALAAKNLQNARALFESHLQSVFTQRGKCWAEKRLGEVAEFKNGLNYTRESNGQTLPVVGVGDFQSNGVVPMDQLQTATIDGELSPEYALQRGDILTVRSNGSKDLVGRCMLVPEHSQTTSYSGFIIRIRVNLEEVFPAFLLHFMKSSDTRDRLTRDGGGANISNINQTKLAALPLFLPPVVEQKKIVAQLDALAAETLRLTRLYEQKQAALAALKKSLLHQAFTGQL